MAGYFLRLADTAEPIPLEDRYSPPPLDEIHISPQGRLGTGSYGTVYTAHLGTVTYTQQNWVVKIGEIRGDEEERNLAKETQFFQSVYGKGTAQFLPYMRDGKRCYCILMRKVPGASLYNYLTTHVTTETERLLILTAILQELRFLHVKGIIHGDLNTNNIHIERLPNGQFKAYFIDFGLSYEKDGIATRYETEVTEDSPHDFYTTDRTRALREGEEAIPADLYHDVFSLARIMYRFTSDQFNFLPFIQRIGAREHDATRLDIDPALVRKVSLDELMTESTQALAKNILSSLGRISLSNLVYFLSAPLSTIEVANRLLVEDRRISIETAFQDELANAIKSQLAQLLIKQCKKDFTFIAIDSAAEDRISQIKQQLINHYDIDPGILDSIDENSFNFIYEETNSFYQTLQNTFLNCLTVSGYAAFCVNVEIAEIIASVAFQEKVHSSQTAIPDHVLEYFATLVKSESLTYLTESDLTTFYLRAFKENFTFLNTDNSNLVDNAQQAILKMQTRFPGDILIQKICENETIVNNILQACSQYYRANLQAINAHCLENAVTFASASDEAFIQMLCEHFQRDNLQKLPNTFVASMRQKCLDHLTEEMLRDAYLKPFKENLTFLNINNAGLTDSIFLAKQTMQERFPGNTIIQKICENNLLVNEILEACSKYYQGICDYCLGKVLFYGVASAEKIKFKLKEVFDLPDLPDDFIAFIQQNCKAQLQHNYGLEKTTFLTASLEHVLNTENPEKLILSLEHLLLFIQKNESSNSDISKNILPLLNEIQRIINENGIDSKAFRKASRTFFTHKSTGESPRNIELIYELYQKLSGVNKYALESLLNLPTTQPDSSYKLPKHETAKQLFAKLDTLVTRMDRYRKNVFGSLLKVSAMHRQTHLEMKAKLDSIGEFFAEDSSDYENEIGLAYLKQFYDEYHKKLQGTGGRSEAKLREFHDSDSLPPSSSGPTLA